MDEKIKSVIVYVDGFNLYFGMKESGYGIYKWLNIKNLVTGFLTANQNLVDLKYFTSRVTNNPLKQKRQATYIEALETTGIKVIYGMYKAKDYDCKNCGHTWQIPNEKMTDVNIATQMLIDAFTDKFDTAILISGDSDLVPPIKSIHKLFPEKSVSVWFPPSRHTHSVASAAKGSLMLGRKTLKSNQFPIEVTKSDGYVLHKPASW